VEDVILVALSSLNQMSLDFEVWEFFPVFNFQISALTLLQGTKIAKSAFSPPVRGPNGFESSYFLLLQRQFN
jgi:hypothetical protein